MSRHSLVALLTALACIAGAQAAEAPAKTDDKSAEQKLESARERLEQAAREVAELTQKIYRDRLPDTLMFLGRNPNRAMLGIGIGGREAEVDEGVAVVSVSPDGPAANAGLKAGDVIVELNGKSLKRDKEDAPRTKLLNEMSKLSPGDEVTLRYTRAGKASIAKLKAERLPQEVARREYRVFKGPGDHGPGGDGFDFDFEVPHGPFMIGRAGAFNDVELVPLTPKLGQYFGIEKGLLVVRSPDKDSKLEEGDVLIDIDGRVPSNPGHAFRILGSYQPGEKLTINVMRQKKKTALAITVPERNERGSHAIRVPIAPVPAVPPAPPVPAVPGVAAPIT